MAFTLNRRLSTLVDSNGQLNTGKIPNDYIDINHIADNSITTAMLHTGFTLPISSLSSIDTDDITEGSTNLFYTTARVDSHLSGGTGVTYSSGAISIGQAVATTDSPTFADLTITGNLNITGDINSYNVTDLDVTDQTITLGAGQIEANSGGSGIIIDGASASILWDETNDQFDFNKGINVDSNTLVVDGTNNRVGILQASPAVSLDIGSATDAFFVPKGTTAQRPTGVDGYFRYNTDDAQFEGYADGAWGAIAGSGGGSAMETNNFTGDGSTTAFTLSSSVSNEDNLIVFIEGIYQNKGDYVASGTTLTFDTAPVNGRRIVVQHIKSSVAGNSTLYTSLTGDGSTTAFTLSGAPGHENNTQVFMDGVYQQKDSYIVNGTTLTFDAAPANNAEIEVMSFAQTTINQPGTNTVSVAELNLSDGTAGQAIVTDGNGTISFASVGVSGIVSSADATAITIDSSERVGIGRTPSIANSKLEVGGADNVPLINVEASGYTGGMGIGSTGLQFFHGSTARMRINSSGNVGINTTSVDAKLHVEGATSGTNLLIDDGIGYGVYVSAQNSFNFSYGRNETSTGYINFRGYQDGNTQFRNLNIGNGKQGYIAFFDGVNSRVGIGTVSPEQVLHVYQAGDGKRPVRFTTGNNQDLDFYNDTDGWQLISEKGINLRSKNGGQLRFTTGSGSDDSENRRMTIDTSGNIGAPTGTNIYNASDVRVKQNISTLSNSLDVINALNPVQFNWIDNFEESENGKNLYGFVAQEVQDVFPDAVESFGTGNDIEVDGTVIENPLTVRDKFFIPVLVKAIQEQQALIQAQATTIADLTARIETLENA